MNNPPMCSTRSKREALRGPKAMRRQFPHVDPETLAVFLESCEDRKPNSEVVEIVAEMQQEAQASAGFIPTRGCTVVPRVLEEGGFCLGEEEIEICFEGGADPPHVGTVLCIKIQLSECPADTPKESGFSSAAVLVPSGELLCLEPQMSQPICFRVEEYGMHELWVTSTSGLLKRCRFMVSSPLGDFAETLDHFHDEYDWMWDGKWTEEFEEAMLLLLSALDDEFTNLEASLTGNLMLGSMLSMIEPPKKRVEKQLGTALEQHDIYNVGRAVSAIRQLLLAQNLLFLCRGGGKVGESAFYQALLAFEKERYAAASPAKKSEIKEAISRLIRAADAHVADIHDTNSAGDFANRWHGEVRSVLVEMRDNPEPAIHPLPFQQLRGGGGGYMADMMNSMLSASTNKGSTVERAATTEAQCTLAADTPFGAAEARMSRWSESLVDESIGFGSFMQPFDVHANEPWVSTVLAAHASIISLGLAYVSQGSKEDSEESTSKFLAIMDRDRATLPLHSESEFFRKRQRRDRLKDVCRVIRAAKKKGQRLSLTVNTDFEGTLEALKVHHSGNTGSWVGPSLSGVWRKMLAEKRVFAFELWLHESVKNEDGTVTEQPAKLVAADFGHPHTCGKAYYVATRFFDRDHRTLQPGYILAFAESECLKRAGFELWDLGGADKSPMMQYKPQVAIEMSKHEFLLRLREISEGMTGDDGLSAEQRRLLPLTDPKAVLPPGGERISTGVVFPDIGEDEIWGAKALILAEERLKAEQKAALKASKDKESRKKNAESKKQKSQGSNPSTNGGYPASKKATSPASPSVPPAPTTKEAQQQRFLVIFQKLVAEGLSQNEAAAKALEAMGGQQVTSSN